MHTAPHIKPIMLIKKVPFPMNNNDIIKNTLLLENILYNDENLKNSKFHTGKFNTCIVALLPIKYIIVDVLFKFKIGLLCSMCSSVCALKKSNNEVDGFAIFRADKASHPRETS